VKYETINTIILKETIKIEICALKHRPSRLNQLPLYPGMTIPKHNRRSSATAAHQDSTKVSSLMTSPLKSRENAAESKLDILRIPDKVNYAFSNRDFINYLMMISMKRYAQEHHSHGDIFTTSSKFRHFGPNRDVV